MKLEPLLLLTLAAAMSILTCAAHRPIQPVYTVLDWYSGYEYTILAEPPPDVIEHGGQRLRVLRVSEYWYDGCAVDRRYYAVIVRNVTIKMR